MVLSVRMRLWTLDSGWPFALSPPRERVSPPLAINYGKVSDANLGLG